MVSFIIPAYNEEKHIAKAIESIYSSKIRVKFEIIVVDDASNDNTSTIIKNKYPNVKLFINQKRMGAAFSRNLGIKNSTGEFICFMDADVWVDELCIQKFLLEIDKYDIVYTIPVLENELPIFPIIFAKNYPVISALFMIKRASLNRLDMSFDEIYKIYNEDLDFFLRCKLFKLKAKYIKEAKAYHWIKENKNPSYRYYMDLRNSIYAYLKFYKIKEKIVGFPSIKIITMNIINFLRNRNTWSTIYFKIPREKNIILKIWHTILPRALITKKTHIYIIYLIIKAFVWNIKHLRIIRKENLKLRKLIK